MTTETVDWLNEETKKTFLAFAIIEMMTQAAQDNGKGWEDTFGHPDPSKFEIACTINGVSVSFIKLNQLLEAQFNHQADKYARKLIDEKVDNILELLDNLRNSIKSKL